jgi:hypothetical protein
LDKLWVFYIWKVNALISLIPICVTSVVKPLELRKSLRYVRLLTTIATVLGLLPAVAAQIEYPGMRLEMSVDAVFWRSKYSNAELHPPKS